MTHQPTVPYYIRQAASALDRARSSGCGLVLLQNF